MVKLFAKVVSNFNLKLLTILAKSSNLDAWLAREYASAGGYYTVLQIQTEISPAQQVRIESFQPIIFIWSLDQLIVWAYADR